MELFGKLRSVAPVALRQRDLLTSKPIMVTPEMRQEVDQFLAPDTVDKTTDASVAEPASSTTTTTTLMYPPTSDVVQQHFQQPQHVSAAASFWPPQMMFGTGTGVLMGNGTATGGSDALTQMPPFFLPFPPPPFFLPPGEGNNTVGHSSDDATSAAAVAAAASVVAATAALQQQQETYKNGLGHVYLQIKQLLDNYEQERINWYTYSDQILRSIKMMHHMFDDQERQNSSQDTVTHMAGQLGQQHHFRPGGLNNQDRMLLDQQRQQIDHEFAALQRQVQTTSGMMPMSAAPVVHSHLHPTATDTAITTPAGPSLRLALEPAPSHHHHGKVTYSMQL